MGVRSITPPRSLRRTSRVVLVAMNQNGYAHEHAPPRLRGRSFKSHVASLISAYTVPTYTVLSTLLFATMVSATTIAFLEGAPPATTRARFEDKGGCVLWKLSVLGEEGVY